MPAINQFEGALDIALDNDHVKTLIEQRENLGFLPVGINMRMRRQNNVWFMQINIDYTKQHANQHFMEDLIVWLRWHNNAWIYHNVQFSHQVPPGV